MPVPYHTETLVKYPLKGKLLMSVSSAIYGFLGADFPEQMKYSPPLHTAAGTLPRNDTSFP